MKTIALALSVLSMLSASVVADDLANFIQKHTKQVGGGKIYDIVMPDDKLLREVKFLDWNSDNSWAYVSYTRNYTPKGKDWSSGALRQTKFIWLNLSQVATIQDAEPLPGLEKYDARNDAAVPEIDFNVGVPPELPTDTTEEAKDDAIDLKADESKGEAEEESDDPNQSKVDWFPEEPAGFGQEAGAVVVAIEVGAEGIEHPGQGGLEVVAVEAENQGGGLVGAAAGGFVKRTAVGGLVAGEAGGALGFAAADEPVESPDVIKRLDAVELATNQNLRHQKTFSLLTEGQLSRRNILNAEINLMESKILLAEAKRESDQVAELLKSQLELYTDLVRVGMEEEKAAREDAMRAKGMIHVLEMEIQFRKMKELE